MKGKITKNRNFVNFFCETKYTTLGVRKIRVYTTKNRCSNL